jgi:LPS export ABC transporter protein LptC
MRKAKIGIIIIIVVIAGVVLTRLWINLREREASGEKEIVPAISIGDADMRLEKIRFVEDKEGRRTWELEAKLIQQYQDQNTMVLEDVTVTFYTKEGRSFVISGKKGKVHQDSRNMELVGDVQVSSSDGYLLKTHSIIYDHAKRKASTSDPVEIEGKKIQLVGKGLQVDMEAKIITVLHQVKAQWKGEKG